MKTTMIVMTISFVAITISAFFLYPYFRHPSPAKLEGVFIRYADHEYGNELDTLALSKRDASGHQYQVIRRWKYERLLDGQLLKPEYKQVKSSLYFLDEQALFVEEETGISYSYNEKKHELTAGTTIYKKIK